MFVRAFRPDRLLRHISSTEPFVEYCRNRGIPFTLTPGATFQQSDVQRWTRAVATLPGEQQIQIEVELAKVNELSDAQSTGYLMAAIAGQELPPDLIPGGAPLALWFLLHHPTVFHDVLLQADIQEVDSWRIARGQPGIHLGDLPGKGTALGLSLREFFSLHEGNGRFVVVDAHTLKDGYCFIAYIADRVQLLDGFTDGGEHTTQRLRPAIPITFVYYPDDGSLLLKSRVRAHDRVLALFQLCGSTVLGTGLPDDCLSQAFDLDRLKGECPLLADADDMVGVRIKTLHLKYPERLGRRQLKLETIARDDTAAIPQLLKNHLGEAANVAQLHVCYAELQVRLRTAGGTKAHLLRLWPDRCNVSQTELGQRFRSCLKRWGLLHAR